MTQGERYEIADRLERNVAVTLRVLRENLQWEWRLIGAARWHAGGQRDPREFLYDMDHDDQYDLRLTLPVTDGHIRPPYYAELQNPDNVSPGQVGVGYRLLLVSEVRGMWPRNNSADTFVRGRFVTAGIGFSCDAVINGADWSHHYAGNSSNLTYRKPVSTPWPTEEENHLALTRAGIFSAPPEDSRIAELP